jgi:hypothetical protein
VPRSFQSRMRENTSEPTTSAHLCEPERMNFRRWSGIDKTAADRLHVEGGCAADDAELVLQQQAVLGKDQSGVEVATMMRSISPALPSGCLQRCAQLASSARSLLLVSAGDVAVADARSLDDPLIRRFDPRATRSRCSPVRRADSCRCRFGYATSQSMHAPRYVRPCARLMRAIRSVAAPPPHVPCASSNPWSPNRGSSRRCPSARAGWRRYSDDDRSAVAE